MKRYRRRRSARANFQHFRVVTARYFKQIVTAPGILLPLLLQAPVLVCILYIAGDTESFVNRSVWNANIVLFMLSVMSALMGILNSYREICKEREILAREIFGGLDSSSYVLSKCFVLFVVGAIQCAVLFGGSLIFVDYAFENPATGYLLCYLGLAFVNFAVTALGLFVSALLKKSESAILPVLLVIIFQVVFCDCVITLGEGTEFLRYITPVAWGIAVFGNVCGMNGWTDGYEKEMYGYSPLISLAALALFALVFVLLTCARLRHEFRQKD